MEYILSKLVQMMAVYYTLNNDGSHAAIPATGFIALEKGFHSYKLYYFEDYEGEHLSWAWKLPSAETLVPIPSSVLYVE